MPESTKRILVVAHNGRVRETRGMLIAHAGYTHVISVVTDDEAMAILETEPFDLVLIGRNSLLAKKMLDQRLREKYPSMLILKVASLYSSYPTRMTDPVPELIITALREMLS